MSFFNSKKNSPQKPESPAASAEISPSHAESGKVIGGLNWYRSQYHLVSKVALGLTLTQCLSLAVIGVLILNRPVPTFFAATPDLRLAPMIPLDRPVLSQQGLLTWASNTITEAMSLDFLEWRKKLEDLRPNFSSGAYTSFLSSLQSSGILDLIRDKRLSASAVTTQAPVIIASGMVEGKATWRIEFPLLVSYESSIGVENTQHLIATVLVSRASTVKTPRGVVIEQVVLKRGTSDAR